MNQCVSMWNSIPLHTPKRRKGGGLGFGKLLVGAALTAGIFLAGTSSSLAQADGTIKWTNNGVGGRVEASPVIGPDGTIYVQGGCVLFAVNGSSPLANSSWPMAQANPRHTANVADQSGSCVSAPAELIAWWRLEGNALDSVGGNNGMLVGSYGFGLGEVGQAIYLTDNPAGISVPNSAALNFDSNVDFSIEAWIQPQVAETDYGVMDIVDKRFTPEGMALGYELCVSSGQLVFQMSDSLDVYPLTVGAGPDLRDGQWHHVAVTVQRNSSTGGQLYVDGAAVYTFDPTSMPGSLANDEALLIGLHPTEGLNCNFRGGIDEVSLYRRALSLAEIQAIYNAGSAGKCPPAPWPCTPAPTNLISWWRVEGNALDSVGSNNGMLVGSYGFGPGEVGQAIYLTNKPAGISVSNSATLNFGSNANFSIEAWIQPQVADTSYGVMDIVDKRLAPDSFSALGYELCVANGQLTFQMCDKLGVYPLSVQAGPDLRDGQWHHVAVTVQRNSTTGGQLYVDGVAVYTFDPTSKPGSLANNEALLIGLHPTEGLDCNFRGGIDEVSLYSRALSPAEIQSIYNAGSAGKCPLSP